MSPLLAHDTNRTLAAAREGFAVGCGGIDLVWRAGADVTIENDERRPVFRLAEDRERLLDALEIVGIADPQHMKL